jgi:hypothetical protein
VLLSAVAGTNYYILAGGYNSAAGELHIVAGGPPTLKASLTNSTVTVTWPSYYSPWYVLQLQTGSLSINPWQNLLPNNYYGTAVFNNITSNPPTFYRLVTP